MTSLAMMQAISPFLNANALVAVYNVPSSWEDFNLGRFIFINPDWYILSAYKKYGVWDGYAVRSTSNLFRFDVGGYYVSAIENLVDWDAHQSFPLDISTKSNPLLTVLEISKTKQIPIEIWGGDHSMSKVGIVEDIKGGILTMQNLDRFGKYDAKMRFDIDEISAVDIFSQETRSLSALMQRKAPVVQVFTKD